MSQKTKTCSQNAVCHTGPLSIDQFINEFGRECKTCPGCREKSKTKSAEPANRLKHKLWLEKQDKEKLKEYARVHTKNFRARQLDKDPVAYRKIAAENQRRNKNTKLTSYKTRARERDISWELEDTQAKEFFTKACIWCGFLKEGVLNGIDRLDSTRGYFMENCAPCCSNCNHMKGCFDPITFTERCKAILDHVGKNPPKVPENIPRCGNHYNKLDVDNQV